MIIASDGNTTGLISGGCVDADLRERAQAVIDSGIPSLVTYDSTSPQDIVMGLGIGCNGVMNTLLEPLAGADHLEFIASAVRDRTPAVVATVFASSGSLRTQPAHRIMATGKDTVGEIPDAELAQAILGECRAVLTTSVSHAGSYIVPAGSASVFFEAIRPPLALAVFGGGADAVPLARLAKELGWHVSIIDHRPAYAQPALFPEADRVVLAEPGQLAGRIPPDDIDVAVIMTHNFMTDAALLRELLPSAARYVGLLGPKNKSRMLLAKLRDEGFIASPQQCAKFYAPVGIDIGSETPQEIALAIVAEIQMVLAGRTGGSLRDRSQPIHQ
jgi:xanthine/CO dehydrogenase XdhC/CoxF family maturation factor